MSEEKIYEIVEDVANITNREGKWNLKLKRISWHGRDPKFDLRSWSPDEEKMGKGLTLTQEEFDALKEYFKSL